MQMKKIPIKWQSQVVTRIKSINLKEISFIITIDDRLYDLSLIPFPFLDLNASRILRPL